jgi:uncharacterized protein HemX
MDERLVDALRRVAQATRINTLVFLLVVVGLGVSSWFAYRMQSEVVGLRAETKALREEVRHVMEESEQQQVAGMSQTLMVSQQLKRLGEKMDELPKDKK